MQGKVARELGRISAESVLEKDAIAEWIMPKYYEAKALQNRAGQSGIWNRIKALYASDVARAQAQEAINKKQGVGAPKAAGVRRPRMEKDAIAEWIMPKYYEAKALQNRAGQSGVWNRIKALMASDVARAQAQEAINEKKGIGVPKAARVGRRRMQKASVAREIGRVMAQRVLVKRAQDETFKMVAALAKMLGKRAGLADFEVEDMVKSAAFKKQANPMLPLLAAYGVYKGGQGVYDWGKNKGWWGTPAAKTEMAGAGNRENVGGEPLIPANEQRMFRRGGWDPKAYRQSMGYAGDLAKGLQSQHAINKEYRNMFNLGSGMWG